ncbi:helix-turn-helix domain-containing protein [Microcoleus sp. CAWBG58]|uniref:helix-turn-helix domain-containing protein n=1 Tax=Microcoleus sp. CAWBG58 TaxID=2841651 RepID=UPI0025D813DA|nr:helix-turn-helix domain-containing protein [Microcoleus sp. CAWBG58]
MKARDAGSSVPSLTKLNERFIHTLNLLRYQSYRSVIKVAIVLKAVKVRIYPTDIQQAHLAQAFGCVRWVWNQSLSVMSLTYKETGYRTVQQ